MVIPLPPMHLPQGEPPASCAEDIKRLKYSVVAMIATGVGRFVFAYLQNLIAYDIFPEFNVLLCIVMAAFFFKDDEHLKSFYQCLAQSICQPCAESGQTGMACLVPLMICSMMNAVFDLLLRYTLMQFMPFGIFLIGNILSQFMVGLFSFNIFKALRAATQDVELGGVGGVDRANYGPPGHAPPGAAPQQQEIGVGRGQSGGGAGGGGSAGGGGQGFVPFAGTGNRLGS